MSTFRYAVEIGDPAGSRFERVESLVDTGATFTVVPEAVLHRLGVSPVRRMPFRLADGSVVEREVGETKLRLAGQTVTSLVVFGDESMPALLGVYTLEAALLSVDPVRQRLVPTEALLMTAW